MIFLAGPRQSGKTTFSQIVSKSFTNHIYFNWDISSDRERFISEPSFFENVERKDMSQPLVVLDEIHKYKEWKNYLKGVYDKFHHDYQFLISGSGRLDLYQKGSDSLAGRYFLYHMWPFTVAELAKKNRSMDDFLQNPLSINMEQNKKLSEIWDRLSEFSGFPEPYLSGKKKNYRRWSNTYSRQLIREDIRDLTNVKAINEIETLFMLIPSKTGSPLSSASLARDLHVSYNTIKSWLSIFETFFMVFSITPWTKKISRAILKERKYYMWDSPRITDQALRFENMVALELYRAITSWNDIGHGTFSMHFIKNKEKQEVDFLLTKENEPFLLVEAKLTDTQPSKSLIKFQNKLNIPGVQLTKDGSNFKYLSNGNFKILVAPGFQWLSSLP